MSALYFAQVRPCAICDLRPRMKNSHKCAECQARFFHNDGMKSEQQAFKLAAALTCPGCYAKDCAAVWNAPGYGWVCPSCGPTDKGVNAQGKKGVANGVY